MESVSWQFSNATDIERKVFSSFSKTVAYEGQEINENLMSRLTKVEVEGRHYYIKAYDKSGKGIRRYLGRSRIRAEWENLELIAKMNIPTLEWVAFGEEKKLLGSKKGVLVTRDLPGVEDLEAIANSETSALQQGRWINSVSQKLSSYVRIMHDHNFVHGDLKWRNILVNRSDPTEVYVFDCPQGRRLPGVVLAPVLNRAKIKDLACLDKVAKYKLRRTQRMRFYLSYSGLEKLNRKHKARIRRILSFFTGRE